MSSTTDPTEVAVLGGGCFWCLEAVYQELRGVSRVRSGYGGGPGGKPTYQQVCTGTTGHVEVVEVTFDPSVITYREILEIFFAIHDPTTLNRQGADVGSQYRSAIFTHSEAQQSAAKAMVLELETTGVWSDPIVTEICPAPEFFAAEDYHQNYFRDNPAQPYCQAVINPKLSKFRERFAEKRQDV